ncbi:MAG: SRPBCC family protein [Bacteroidia bacterium]
MNITTTIIINKPVKQVWDFYDNPDNLKLWLTNFKSFELLAGIRVKPVQKQNILMKKRGD